MVEEKMRGKENIANVGSLKLKGTAGTGIDENVREQFQHNQPLEARETSLP